MSMIYLANPQGQQTQHEEAEAHRLWSAGAIPAGTLYWREGMAEWRPAAEFFTAPAASPAASPLPPSVSMALLARGFVKHPGLLTRWLVMLLWTYLGASLLSSIYSTLWLATGQAEAASSEEMTMFDWAAMLLALPQLGIVIATGVVFLMWIHRANKNARGLGAQGLKFTPGWAVGYYFIPILNLWRPYQAMKEIWQASKNPAQWVSQKAPGRLGLWWGLWLVGSFLERAAWRLSWRAETTGELMASEVFSLAASVLDIPLCLVAISLVREIVQMQAEWAAQPVQSGCAICQRPFPPSEMILLNNAWVCAECKPVMVQQLREGAAGP